MPTNADDPNMNTISFKPDEVLTQTADWGTKNVDAYACANDQIVRLI